MSTTAQISKDEMLARVFPEVVSVKEDADLVRQCPHAQINGTDLSFIPRIKNPDGTSDLVTKDMSVQCRLTETEVMRAAIQNMNSGRDGGYVIAPLHELIGMPADPDAPLLLVVTNQSGKYGAAEALNPKVQKELSEKLGGDYIVLPSSKHECICLSVDGMDIDQLQSMVADINSTEVSHEDKLSDSVYKYDFQTKKFGMASDMQEANGVAQGQAETAVHGRGM